MQRRDREQKCFVEIKPVLVVRDVRKTDILFGFDFKKPNRPKF